MLSLCDLIHLNRIWKYFNMSRFRFRIFKTTLEFNKFKYYPLILEKRRATFWREGDIVFISETIILFQYRDNYFQKILSEKMIPYRISERGEGRGGGRVKGGRLSSWTYFIWSYPSNHITSKVSYWWFS